MTTTPPGNPATWGYCPHCYRERRITRTSGLMQYHRYYMRRHDGTGEMRYCPGTGKTPLRETRKENAS